MTKDTIPGRSPINDLWRPIPRGRGGGCPWPEHNDPPIVTKDMVQAANNLIQDYSLIWEIEGE